MATCNVTNKNKLTATLPAVRNERRLLRRAFLRMKPPRDIVLKKRDGCSSSSGRRRPFSKWSERVPRLAARGSCVTMMTVFPHFAAQRAQDLEDGFRGMGVEIAGGFVGDDQLGVGDDGARDGDTLLLAAGQLRAADGAPDPKGRRDRARWRPSPCVAAARTAVRSSGSSTFSAAVRTGMRLNVWKMNPTF